MTDLISKLADDLLALINAKPRSPTKEEIEGVLRQTLDGGFIVPKDFKADGAVIAPGWITYDPYPRRHQAVPTHIHTGDSQGEGVTTVSIDGNLTCSADAVRGAIMPLPYTEPSPEFKQAMEVFEKCRQELRDTLGLDRCLAHTDGQHVWGHEHSHRPNECACGARKP